MPTTLDTPYPFADDGDIIWNLDDPWFDPLIWLRCRCSCDKSCRERHERSPRHAEATPLQLAKHWRASARSREAASASGSAPGGCSRSLKRSESPPSEEGGGWTPGCESSARAGRDRRDPLTNRNLTIRWIAFVRALQRSSRGRDEEVSRTGVGGGWDTTRTSRSTNFATASRTLLPSGSPMSCSEST